MKLHTLLASKYHSKKFIERLEKAALKAEGIERQDLAAEIRKDCEVSFGPSSRLTSKQIEWNIEEAMRNFKYAEQFWIWRQLSTQFRRLLRIIDSVALTLSLTSTATPNERCQENGQNRYFSKSCCVFHSTSPMIFHFY